MISLRVTGLSLLIALLPALGSCSASVPSSLTVSLSPDTDHREGLNGVVVDLAAPGFSRTLTFEDFDPETLKTAPMRVPDEGELEVRVRLLADGTTIADGGITQGLLPGFSWGVNILRAPRRPPFGAETSFREVPIDEEHRVDPEEALWITWGGREKDASAGIVAPGG